MQRGANQLLGFKLLEPAAEWQRELALLGHIRDPEYVARHVEFTNWFEWVQDVPEAFYLWIVEHLFWHNELAEGTLTISRRRVDLGRINCPLFLIAGRTDHITPPEQVWALAERVGTPAGRCTGSWSTPGTSGCSCAGSRCAITGGRSWPRSARCPRSDAGRTRNEG